ncbi:MAG: hypothetical protein LBI70_03530 [Rickettsiales bacterium]|nr:hypothetical protein [Rickettsiales bacterium]
MVLNEKESDALGEYSLEAIVEPTFDSFANTKMWCEYFYNFIRCAGPSISGTIIEKD